LSEISLLIGAPEWGGPAAAIAAGLLLLILWAYRDPGGASRWRWLAAGLKAVGLATLLFCLVEPLRSGERPRPKANLVPLLVDESRSMAIEDAAPGGRPQATDALRQRLAATTA